MEAMHTQNNFLSQTIKHSIPPRKRTIDKFNNYRPASTYTETLLREYKILVEVLARLDDSTFKIVYPEVNAVADKLKKWFNQPSSNDTLETYWTMRRLRQKIRNGALS